MRRIDWAACLLVVGCGSTLPPLPAPKPAPAKSGSLAPFEDGTVLAYETGSRATGGRGLVMLRVHRPRPGLIELDDGHAVQRLYVEGNDLRHGEGGYLLKGPFTQGTVFPGRFGQVTVTGTDVVARVPAGSFVGCLETTEQSPTGDKRARTVFCPDVGMVSLEVEGATGHGHGAVRYVLKSYGPAVDFAAKTHKQ